MGDSTDAAVGVLLSLAEETRDDVKEILGRMAAAEQRLTSLEASRSIVAAPPPQASAGPTLTRDAGLVGGTGALVAAVMQIIAALGK